MESEGAGRGSALQQRLQARREMFLKSEGAGGGGAGQVGADQGGVSSCLVRVQP
jgi:hypothetical protein